jgi:hypothetical protein
MRTLIAERKVKRLPPREPGSAIYIAMLFSEYRDWTRGSTQPSSYQGYNPDPVLSQVEPFTQEPNAEDIRRPSPPEVGAILRQVAEAIPRAPMAMPA